jgi:uridine kinase
VSTPARRHVLQRLADLVASVRRPHPVRVAIDGPDAAGKTTLADELSPFLEQRGTPVIRASIDDFHRPRVERYRRGRESPEGYYHDSFDHDALCAELLRPLGPGGSRRYRTAAFDLERDAPRASEVHAASDDAVLLFDGVFLLRPELDDCWDVRIYVDVGFGEILRRAATRDEQRFGSREEVRRRYERRYLRAQLLYLRAVDPRRRADVVVENDVPTTPRLLEAGRPR